MVEEQLVYGIIGIAEEWQRACGIIPEHVAVQVTSVILGCN